ncbi:MAG: hypothetical protein AAB685_01175 [Patescibacteria group bacterium]
MNFRRGLAKLSFSLVLPIIFLLSAKDVLAASSFTVETLIKNGSGKLVRLTSINADTIVRYMEADGTLTKPRVCYQGTNGGLCSIKKSKNCMSDGFFRLKITDDGKPCTAVKRGYYSTQWLKKVTVGGVNYKLIHPTWNCKDGICTQEEFINRGIPYHYAIYEEK